MSRQIDPENVLEEDVDYLLQRPWLLETLEYNGAVLPDRCYTARGLPAPQRSAEPVAEVAEVDETDEDDEIVEVDETVEVDEDDDKDEDDEWEYSDLNVSELKEILQERGLPVSGTKGELIKRLEENDQQGE